MTSLTLALMYTLPSVFFAALISVGWDSFLAFFAGFCSLSPSVGCDRFWYALVFACELDGVLLDDFGPLAGSVAFLAPALPCALVRAINQEFE